jgi:hypothetical protein
VFRLHLPSQSYHTTIGTIRQWKHDWLECCEMLPDYLKKLDSIFDESLLDIWLEKLREFERTTNELEGWGLIESVLCRLDSDPNDKKLSKSIERVRSNRELTRVLEEIWQDEQQGLIKMFQLMADERLRAIVSTRVPELWYISEGMDICMDELGQHFNQQALISYYAFICFRRLRDSSDYQRNS